MNATRPDAAANPVPVGEAGDGAVPDRQPSAPLPPTAVSGLCDGSDRIRLVATEQAIGVPVPTYLSFGYPYGEFFTLDGHCHFYAQGDYAKGIHEGPLSPDELAQLTGDLALGELDSLPSTRSGCHGGHNADFPSMLIATMDASLICGCDECAEMAATAVMLNAQAWMKKLAASGTPVQGSVRALAYPGEPFRDDPSWRVQNVEAWPLSHSMHDIAGLITHSDTHIDGAGFDGEDATTLRALRTAEVAMPLIADYTTGVIFVREGCGPSYALLVRDELPDAFAQELSGFLSDGWSREPPL